MKRRSNLHVIIEQNVNGFRYRVYKRHVLMGASGYYKGFDDALYALQARYPTYADVKVEAQ